ncbi:aryl hydrocarbon receptor-like [Odontesthes bonariensis]|uniref:aryl hydrocarbon receptor-like n=1 Tax=Odontesthes bonariensis TaxID=219752 RepID=UPI003F585A36
MSSNMYAGRKRRKPAQKGVKPTPAEGGKSNPSKRHRDRLNSELDRLASLLPFPEEVISSLDKLSILRLSVSFLRTKSFFSVALKNPPPNGTNDSLDGDGRSGSAAGRISEGELLLQALNGFILVVTADGSIFFCSHTIQDYLGFHQTDVMHQSVFELIHTEDQQEFRRNLHWALDPPACPGPPTDAAGGEAVPTPSCLVSYTPDQLPPENSSFLERGFVCRFRCLLDNSSGFLPLNIQGRLKFLHGQSRQRCDSSPPQLALFAIATPLQPPAILEIRTKNMIFRTKHKLDFTPMACDAKGKIVLGYTEAELRVRGSGYQFIHAADMLYCAENHVRMIKTGESGLTVFRLLTKDNKWKWVQSNARLVYKSGKPDYIIATQRPLVEEEGGEHLRKRSMHLPFTFATGEALLYQTGYPLHGFPDSFQGKAKGSKSKKGKVEKSCSEELNPKSLLGALMSQDESVYVCQPDPEPKASCQAGVCNKADGPDGPDGPEGSLGGGSWNGFDPLLATLDSLSLDGGETCSNSELFSALENLGLNAEDLELLLLDERMMQVELDPNHIPTLTDLLTNNEILSYIHDSLETEREEPVSRPPNHPPAHGAPQQACLPPAPPILQLSQQMLQHAGGGQPGQSQPVSLPAAASDLTGVPHNHWALTAELHPHPSSYAHQHPHAAQLNGEHRLLNAPHAAQLNGEHRLLNAPHAAQLNGEHRLLNAPHAAQLNGEHRLLNAPPHGAQLNGEHRLLNAPHGAQLNGEHRLLNAPQWQLQQLGSEHRAPPGFQLTSTTNGSLIPNGHSAFPLPAQVGQLEYSVSLHQGFRPVQLHHKQPQTRVAPPQSAPPQSAPPQSAPPQSAPPQSAPPQSAPPQSAALELEQLLALSQPQGGRAAYGVFMPAADSKVENGRRLDAADVRTCLMPNKNAAVTSDVPRPAELPALQDPQKSGFFL